MFTQCRFNVGPASQTLAQHWTGIGRMSRVYRARPGKLERLHQCWLMFDPVSSMPAKHPINDDPIAPLSGGNFSSFTWANSISWMVGEASCTSILHYVSCKRCLSVHSSRRWPSLVKGIGSLESFWGIFKLTPRIPVLIKNTRRTCFGFTSFYRVWRKCEIICCSVYNQLPRHIRLYFHRKQHCYFRAWDILVEVDISYILSISLVYCTTILYSMASNI